MKTKFLIILFITFCFNLSSQVILEHLTKKDGLPSNYTSGIIQDNDGYIWIATPKGAVRYDGKTMKTYTVEDGLTTNEIVGFFKDGIGRIWFNCFGGKACYYYKGRIYNIFNDKRLDKIVVFDGQLFSIDSLIIKKVLLSSKNKVIWTRYHTINLNELSNDTFIYNPENVSTISNLIIDVDKSTIYKYNPENYLNHKTSFKPHHLIDKNYLLFKLETDTVFIIDLRDNSAIFKFHFEYNVDFFKISKDKKILLLSYETNSIYFFKKQYLLFSLNIGSFIRNYHIDEKDNLWVGTDNGLYKINYQIKSTISSKISLPIYLIKKIDDKIYIGTSNQKVIELDTIKKGYHISSLTSSPSKRVLDIVMINNRFYGVGDFGLQNLMKGNKKFNGFQGAFKNASSKSMKTGYISAGPSGVILYNSVNESFRFKYLYGQRTFNVLYRKNGELLASTIDGILLWKNDSLPYQKIKLPFSNIGVANYINEDKNENLIFSTNNGLIIESNKNYYKVDKSKGLLDNHINKTFTSADGKRLYVCTNKGFNVVDYSIDNKKLYYKIKSYTTSDGLPSDEVNCALEDDDNVYVGTMEGLFALSVKDTIKPFTIPIRIESILVNDSMLELKNKKKWNHHQNSFQFNFSAFYYQRNREMQFSYQLTPIDQTPVISDNPSIIYRGLAPGDYTLKVFAFDKHYPKLRKSKVWTYRFTISPPYYKTWWFISLITLLIVSGGFLAYINYIRRKQKQNLEVQALLKQMAQHRLEALKGQMNPHFIFNSLNTVQHFISSHNEREAMDFIAKFSCLIRKMLDLARVDRLSLEKEIQFLKDYAEIEQIRYAHKFDVDFICDVAEQDDIELPTMLVQPLLENAIKHGVSNLKERRGRIEVVIMTVDEHWLNIKIKDNGNGLVKREESSKSHTSAALDIIRERLAVYEVDGRKGRLDILFSENGTVSELVVPI